jgi:uncharacterized protein
VKYLVLLGILLVFYLVWRYQRTTGSDEPKRPPPPALPQDMVRCPVCQVHLPRAEAVADRQGRLYCCRAHLEKLQ